MFMQRGPYLLAVSQLHFQFRKYYQRGDLPLALESSGARNSINWKVDLAKVDYHYYLPLFFDGIREKEEPFRFLAVKGVEDLLKVIPCPSQLIDST